MGHFLKTRSLQGIPFNEIQHSEINICKFNRTRKEINKQCDEQHKGNKITFRYQGKPETYKVYEGMRLMCSNNLHGREMYNSETYTFDKINENKYEINKQKPLLREKFN